MSDAHNLEHAHSGPTLKTYLLVFGALSVFTLISFVVNATIGRGLTGLIIILGVSVCKTVLVGLFFMHLIVDWPKLYYLIFPTFILGAMFITVLLIEVVLVWHHLGPIMGPVTAATSPGP
jgi:caa(3)-type oxidase subunit IV